MTLRSIIISFAAISSVAISASTISISDIVNQIEANNLGLKTEQTSNQAAIAESHIENSLPATSIEYSPFFRSGVTGLASSELVVSQEFEFPSIYSARKKQVDSQRYALDMEMATQRRNLRIEATKECLSLVYALRLRKILSERYATTDTLLALYRKKFELRDATQIDVNKISITLQDLNLALLENGIDIEEAENRLVSLNAGRPLDFSALDYEGSISQINLPADINDYAISRPEVASAIAGIALADREVSVAKQSNLPSISIGYRRNTELNEASNGFLVGVSVPLFSFNRQKKVAEAKKAAAMAQADDAMNKALSEAASTIRNLAGLRAAIEACDTSLIRETLSLYRRSLDAGRITLTDYYIETDRLYERLAEQERLEFTYRSAAALLLP